MYTCYSHVSMKLVNTKSELSNLKEEEKKLKTNIHTLSAVCCTLFKSISLENFIFVIR